MKSLSNQKLNEINSFQYVLTKELKNGIIRSIRNKLEIS